MNQCYNSTVVSASIEDVWKSVRNFHDLSWANPVITSLEVVGDISGDTVGAKRLLNGLFHETLTILDTENHCITYVIEDGPEPISKSTVANYVGLLELSAVTDENTTFVEWSSTYESSDPDAVHEFCNPIYVALLSALKQHFAK